MTARSTWKGYERRVAAAVGGRRIPVTGIDRDGVDVDAGPFVYQVKLRARASATDIRKWLEGICRVAQAEEHRIDFGFREYATPTGVLVWKEPGQCDEDALVILRFADWRALHGK